MSVRPVFFLHIPKTAGTALAQFFEHRFPVGTIQWVNNGAAVRERPELLEGARLVTGHVGYRFARLFRQRPIILTFLREPVDRAISNFYFYRQLGDHGLSEFGVERAYHRAAELSLREFMEQEPRAARYILGNAQTRMLAGEDLPEPSRAALEDAKRNLAACEFVGLTERMPESMTLLCRTMDWPTTDVLPAVNRTEGRPARDALDAPTLAMLHEWTALDRELYQFAEGLFEQRLSGGRVVGPASGPLPDSAALTFDQEVPGYGWLKREWTGRDWLCWLEREAWLEFRLAPRRDLRLRFLVWFVHPRQRAGVAVEANGQPLALRSRTTSEGIEFVADVPRSVPRGADGVLKLTFRARESLRPCDVTPGSPDERRLGLALLRVEVAPRQKGYAFLRALLAQRG